jgi:para-nitrobenzyl esterase
MKTSSYTQRLGRFGLLLSCLAASVAFAPAWAHNRADVIVTDKGPVIGALTSEGRQFLGIPYAAPPVGELRWQAPKSVTRWTTPRLAQQFGNNCPQFGTAFGLQSFDEDCLYLNVYTPPAGKGRAGKGHDERGSGRDPVMVWLHPGAFQFGEGEDYDPRKLVARGVIVVTVNYRLGALGFLAHPALTAESAQNTSGNYALMDQQAALKWVRKNIAHFGGDPNNVTVFGESAGGMSVHAHLASPKSRGLFDRAIVQSGAYSLTQPTLAAAEVEGRAFADAVGCVTQDAACLRALPVTTVLANQRPGILGFLPNVDGVVLPMSVGDAFASGKFNRVPVMQGSTHDEYRLFVPLFFDFATGPLIPELYPVGISIVLGVPPTSVPAVMAEYPLANYPSPSIALAALATDAVFACTRQAATDNLSRYVSTYVYEFNDSTAPQRYLPPASFPYGAAHESELQYLFDIVTTLPAVPLNTTQEKLSRAMVTAWSNFAYTGNPNLGPQGVATPLWFRNNYTGYVHSLASPRPQPYSNAAFDSDHKCAFWRTFAP